MISFLRFILGRLLIAFMTLFFITAILYGIVMMTPPETRAELYIHANLDRLSDQKRQEYVQKIIHQYGLNDPYPVQYFRWIANLAKGEWGYSPTMNENVLSSLLSRTPVTAELTLYSLLLLIPLGLLIGAVAGWNRNERSDYAFRATAFVGSSLPTFVLALVMIAIFYIGLHWFPPDRLGYQASQVVRSPGFIPLTGLLTIDGLLNGHSDVSLDAARHLVLPVITLSMFHWATLGRMVRATMIEEKQKDYVTAAKARGLSDRAILWRHPFPNTVAPALTSSALSAAALVTGVFVVERIYNFHGVSELVLNLLAIPDAPATLGFALYNVITVLLIMLLLDIIRGIVDPRAREGWVAQ
jgi:peptide/nickel transport system permease protein